LFMTKKKTAKRVPTFISNTSRGIFGCPERLSFRQLLAI